MKNKFFLAITLLIVVINFSIAQTAYISNSGAGTISVIDATTNTVTDTINGVSNAFGISVSPNGSKVYFSDGFSSVIGTIKTTSNTVVHYTGVDISPNGIAVSPDGSKIYVASELGNVVNVVSTATNTVIDTIAVGINPQGVCISPDGSKVYVTSYGYNAVYIINTSTNSVSSSIIVGTQPWGIAITPNGSKLYVANNGSNTVSVINTATNVVSATIPVGNNPYGVSVSPDGSRTYVANDSSNTVSVINTNVDTVSATITVGSSPRGASVTPDGSKLYVTNYNDSTVSVINTASNTVSTTIAVGYHPVSFGNFISIYNTTCFARYTTTYDSTLNNFTLYVDSIPASLAIAYHWDFGDGTTSALAAPTHIYTLDTVYNVCMKIYTATGDSCEYCHIIGKDYLGNIYRTTGFTLNVNHTTTSLSQLANINEKITIAPNPFTSQTSITFSEEQTNTTIKITDVLGKEIRTINFTGRQLTIDKGEMKAGIYFLQTIDEKKNITNNKIIIQ